MVEDAQIKNRGPIVDFIVGAADIFDHLFALNNVTFKAEYQMILMLLKDVLEDSFM